METPVQVAFRGMPPSEAIEAVIRQRIEWLEGFNARIVRCHVVVDVPRGDQHKGRAYNVRVDITTPTGEIVASSHDRDEGAGQDIHAVIRTVFDTARRQLEGELSRRRPA